MKMKFSRVVAPRLCTYCANVAEVTDHYIPRCLGGSDAPDNLVPACKRCNSSKGGNEPWYWACKALTDGVLGGPQPDWEKRIEAVLTRSHDDEFLLTLRTALTVEADRYERASIEFGKRAARVLAMIEQVTR